MSANGTPPTPTNAPKTISVPAPERGDVVRRGFDNDQLERTAETASTAMAAQATASVQARHIMALKNPRDLLVVREKLLRDCSRPALLGRGHLSQASRRRDQRGRAFAWPRQQHGR